MPMATNSPRMTTLRDSGEGSAPPIINDPYKSTSSEPASPTSPYVSKQSTIEVSYGMRTAINQRSRTFDLNERLNDNIDEYVEESDDEKDQVMRQAIMEDGQREAKKSETASRYVRTKRHINRRMKYHHDLVAHGFNPYIPAQKHPHPWCRSILVHPLFETAMAVLIVANCVMIGWQAELRNPEGATQVLNQFIEQLFTILFFSELMLRAIVFNWTFWFDVDNHLDIFLVTLSVLNSWILGPAGVKADFLRKASVLRILRLVRIARNFKRQYKEMWQLLHGLIDSFETLVWTYVMMLCVLYFFAISATTLFAKIGAYDDDPTAKAIVEEHFDDVLVSMLTLFQIMTLDSWTSIVRPLMAVQVWAVFFFIMFITVSVFLMMNLITSVIVTETFKHGRADKAEQAADMEAAKEKAIKELVGVFQEMDEDGGGTLSKEEVAKAWKNRKVRQKFRTMDIGKKDLVILWTALDDGDGELTIEEFIQGMRKMKGEAKAKDILKLYREVRVLEHAISDITILSDYSKDKMDGIRMKLRSTFRELEACRRTLNRVKETARLAAKSQPLCV